MISFEPDVFLGHPIQEFTIRYSNLTSPVPLTHIKSTLEQLDLTNNKIRFIPLNYFHGCRISGKVIFSHTRISSLPDLGYISDTLYELWFPGNLLRSVDIPENVTFPQLNCLSFRSNFISFLDISFISSMPSLRALYLSRNNITQLQNPENFVISGQKVNFYLRNNPWHCGKSLTWMLKWDRTKTFSDPFAKFVIDLKNVECHTPRNLKGTKLFHISKYNHLRI